MCFLLVDDRHGRFKEYLDERAWLWTEGEATYTYQGRSHPDQKGVGAGKVRKIYLCQPKPYFVLC